MGPTSAGAAIITTYFLVLVFCAFLSVAFAFFLRFSMRVLHAESMWQWMLAGTVLAIPMVFAVRWGSRVMDSSGVQGVGREIAVLLFLGVRGIAENHPILGLPVAALTASVLFLIHRAFSEQTQS